VFVVIHPREIASLDAWILHTRRASGTAELAAALLDGLREGRNCRPSIDNLGGVFGFCQAASIMLYDVSVSFITERGSVVCMVMWV
jgi:hypothetical protein